MSGDRKKLRAQRRRLCEAQRWRCHYCNVPMRWVELERGQRPPPDMATTEHLDDRFSPRRGNLAGQLRHVAACLRCNRERGRQRVIEQNRMGKEGLR